MDEILNFNAYVSSEKNLSVSFELNIPVTDKSEQFSVTHFDTSYFISFSEPKKDDLLIIGDFYTAIYKNRTTPYVITSYSIHYTKLYDRFLGNNCPLH